MQGLPQSLLEEGLKERLGLAEHRRLRHHRIVPAVLLDRATARLAEIHPYDAPAVLGWATGSLPEPKNNPQVGMANMRLVMPALQKAAAAPVTTATWPLRAT